MAETTKKPKWWYRQNEKLDKFSERQILDDDLVRLLEEVESEFKDAYQYHATRLQELKEAIRARQEAERG